MANCWSLHREIAKGGIGPLHQQVTIGSLPDDVLLKFFKYAIREMYYSYSSNEKWRTLVHVCRRWRNMTFTYPRHLNLELVYSPSERSVKEMLDIWPELPIYIWAFSYPTMETITNVVAALTLNHRVSRIRFNELPNWTWKRFGPLMERPFPALTDFYLRPYSPDPVVPISRSFLGGSAPCLQDLYLESISFPALPNLLLTATNLVRLSYIDIPPSGYIPPQAMATGLSALTRLQRLSLTFQPESFPYRAIRIPPPHTRTLLPALTYLCLRGVPEYVEDLVAQVDTPLLESTKITLFHREVLEVSELSKFVRRADKLSLRDRAEVTFESDRITVLLSEIFEVIVDPKTLRLCSPCPESNLRLSYLAQFCASCLPTLSPFESLHILVPRHYTPYSWPDVTDNHSQWLELLRLFNTVKELRLSITVAPRVAQVLRGLPAERVSEVLPALENVFISGLNLYKFNPVKEIISEFVDARQLSAHPVSIHHWKGRGRFAR